MCCQNYVKIPPPRAYIIARISNTRAHVEAFCRQFSDARKVVRSLIDLYVLLFLCFMCFYVRLYCMLHRRNK